MLKFATKKPPRLKHSEQATASAHLDRHGRIFSDEGSGYLKGDFTRFERINGDDMIHSANQNAEYRRPVQSVGLPNSWEAQESVGQNVGHTIGQNVGHTTVDGRGSGQPNIHWKAYNVKYGKVGVDKEIEYPQVPPERHVGLSRNGGHYVGQRSGPQYVDQRSQFNPGYLDHTLDNRGPYDMNRNIHSDGIDGFESEKYYPKGSGYQYPSSDAHLAKSRPPLYGQDYNANQQYPCISQSQNLQHVGRLPTASQRLPHESPFPSPMMSADNTGNNGIYGPAYSVDSSMSIDSMSTSGDRSSKSMSETLDYDMLLDFPQVTKRGLDLKPPVPHKHRHVHVGRGTHGVCEGATSPVRPGSSECQMTSSLRKSPSGMKSGHHVRWGPAVVNSNQNIDGQIRSQIYAEPPVAKKGKKKTSLRSLLNLPKFPLSDDESADDLPQSVYTGQNARKEPNVANDTVLHGGTLRKFLGYHRLKKKPFVAPSQPVTTNELASLRYKNDYQMNDNFKDSQGKGSIEREHILRLHITEANQHLPQSAFLNGYGFEQDNNAVQHTGAIRYPIMHSGRDQSIFGREAVPEASNRSPVNSVRPFLINGQANETQDYDFCTETEPQKSQVISVKLRDRNKVNVLHQGNVSNPQLYDKNAQTTNSLQTTTATFDTYVTLGRPTVSSVTFDTFVTLGRPFATSTPIPNTNFGNDHNLGQEFQSSSASYDEVDSRRKWLPNFGLPDTRGHVDSSITQSWNYSSPGNQYLTSVPLVTHSVQASSREPVMHARAGTDVTFAEGSHEGHSSGMGSPRPYNLDNRVYGGLSMPSGTFINTAPPVYGPQVTQSANLGQITNDLELLNESSQGQSLKQNENVQFKDTCTYHELDTGDYDDDEVFFNLGLTPSLEERSQTVRRKLDFEGLSNCPVVTSCVPQLNHELNHEDTLNHNYSGFPKVQAVPGITQQRGTMSSNLNETTARDHVDGGEMACILDLVYITERIISMSFASEEHDNTYKYNLKEVTRMLKTKHGDNYLVINISEKKSELAKHCPQVLDYGWPDNLAPPLERLCSICKAIDQWMGKDSSHVVVVHCKGGRGRIAVVIAAYMRYSNICASADQALDRFAMKRFYDDKLGGLPQPSQRRYVHYFAGLLSGAIQINSSALYLHHILIHGVPNFDTRGGCRPFIKVYQGMHPIFTSGVYNVTDNMQKVCISISPGIPLRGDILIKCYHKKNNAGQREMIWGCQFHTCAISHNSLVFSKNELDYGINDPRFPDSGKVEFVFGNNSEGLVQVADFKSDVTVPVDDSTEALTRWDSYENFGKMVDGKETDVNANGLQISHQQQQQHGVDSFRVTQLDHNQGPVDGSLYAQINKRKLESQIIQNGPTKLQNGGSYSSSIDSVPMGTSTTHKTSDSWSYNTRERDFHQPNISSSMNKSYSSSTSPRSAKVALDEQTQLDQILSDLLSDQAFVSQKSSPGTRSFKMVEEHTSPEGTIVVQRGDVTYKVPEVRSENHYTVKTESKTVTDDKYKPVNAFTYTPSSPEMSRSFDPLRSPQSPKAPYRTDYENNFKKESYSYQTNGPSSLSDGEHSLSWLQQQQAKMREKSSERDQTRHRNEQMLLEELKKSQTQNKYFQKRSQSEEESSKVSSPLQNGPVSPYSYTVSRTHTYNTDKSPNDSSFRPHDTLPVAASHTTYITEQTSSKVSNKPPPSPNLQRTVTPTFSAPPVPPPQRTSSRDYMQHQQQQQTQQQQQQTRNRSNSYQQSTSSWRSETQTQPRVTQRHNSESAYDREQFEKQHESRQQFRTPPLSPRAVSPHTFQSYKTVYKTIHNDEPDFSQPQPIEVQLEKQMIKEQQTAVQDVNKPHYITEVIVQRTGGSDSKNSTLNRNENDRQETDNRLDALEKSLQAASHSILASSPWQQQQQQKQQQQQQQQNVMKQEVRQFETRTYETKTEQRQEQRHEQQRVQPVQVEQPPKKIEVTEEDRITLKPIGPGVQQLEPEGSHSGSTLGRDSTLGRATTPSFPTSPGVASAEHIIQAVHEKVRRMSIGSSNQSLNSIGGYLVTPPFPVTPRTPYTNISVSTTPYYVHGHAPRPQQSPFTYGSSIASGQYSSQQSLNSVFEREDPREGHGDHYNTIVSRQLMRNTYDPTYAVIADNSRNAKVGGSSVVSPTDNLQSDKMQYQTQYNQQQSYQTNTLPHSTSQLASQQYQTNTLPHGAPLPVSQPYQTSTLPHQQQQQQFQQQRQYQTSSSQQYHTQQYSTSNNSQDGSLHVDTNPRMLMTQPARSPSSPGSPPSPGNLNTLRQQLHVAHNMSNNAVSPGPHSATGQSSPSVYFGLSRRGSLTSLVDSEAMHTTPRFVKDTSRFWYKPSISREEAIIMLKDKAPGTFVVRDSNSFPGAFGLALKVATLPPNVQTKSTGDPQADLVRHFLIEPTSKGVRLRGCSNEPVFGSLASLVYQHSLTPLALPCKLVLPDNDASHIVTDMSPTTEMPNSASQLLAQGAACNVVYLNSVDTESLTGPQAVARACKVTFENPPPKTTQVHFKVSNQGITLTDNQRKLFFRRHYPVAAVTYCGGDPEDRKWRRDTDLPGVQADARVFGFVARKQGSMSDNCCHLFSESDPDQPASAIVNFVTKVMIGQGKIKS